MVFLISENCGLRYIPVGMITKKTSPPYENQNGIKRLINKGIESQP